MYSEKALNMVIGFILMVAITVLLAAVIAAFVFGMSGTLSLNNPPNSTIYEKNITIIQITAFEGVISSTGEGYRFPTDGTTFTQNHNYHITYYRNDNGERQLKTAIDITRSPYTMNEVP
jgi:hypothetical protein